MTTNALLPANEEGLQLQRNELATAQLQAQAIAFEQAAFLVAHKRPRDMDLVRQKLMKECDRTSFAVTAIYRKPVGNTTVMGLSIRYAEAALNVLGNARTKRIVTLDDLTRRKILIVVSDLETNTHYEAEITIEKTVERKFLKEGQNPLGSRLNSKGERVYLVEATEDDMLTKESAIASKFIRQNALRLVPGWLQDECYDAIMETQKKKAAQDPDAEKNKLVDAFDDMGIRVDQLKNYLGLEDLSTLAPKDLIELRTIYQAIKDGETNWREVMEQRDSARGKQQDGKPTERSSTLADKLKESVAKATGQKPSNVGAADSSPSQPSEAPKPAPVPTDAPEVKPEPAAAVPKSKPEVKVEPGSGKRDDSQSANTRLMLFKNKETSKGVAFQLCEFDSGAGKSVEIVNRHKSLMPLLTLAMDKTCDIWFHANSKGKYELDDIIAIDGVRYEKGQKLPQQESAQTTEESEDLF